MEKDCYGVQAPSAHHTISLGSASILELVDGEDGRLAPQDNHLIRAWMLDSGLEMGEGGGEETK